MEPNEVKNRMLLAEGVSEKLRECIERIERFPEITSISKNLRVRFEVTRTGDNVLMMIEFDDENSLIWMPWKEGQKKPQRNPGDYRVMNMYGKQVRMPRKTKCYGYTYTFSGQTHPITEPTAEILELYAETNSLFSNMEKVNMCLENDYDNGREYISEHSDDEKQFGKLRDVFCWVTGPASREAVFRVKLINKKVPKHLEKYLDNGRDLLSIKLPEGLYVMFGNTFQDRYSHELPQLYPSLFLKLTKAFKDELSDNALLNAEWLKQNPDRVKEYLKTVKKSKPSQSDMYDEWCLERTSYTMRQFIK